MDKLSFDFMVFILTFVSERYRSVGPGRRDIEAIHILLINSNSVK